MRCPECKWPMGLAREEKGVRVWRCEKCKREKRGVTKGEITMSWAVPVRLQEKAVLVLALVALAMPVRAAQLTAPSGTLANCSTGACQVGCSRDGQTAGVSIGGTPPANTQINTGSCAPGGFDFVTADGATQLLVQVTNDQAVAIGYNVEQSIDGGATWSPAIAISFTGPATRSPHSFQPPNGRYRIAVTTCGTGTDCHYVVKYKYTNQR